jgi:hypothetical protein
MSDTGKGFKIGSFYVMLKTNSFCSKMNLMHCFRWLFLLGKTSEHGTELSGSFAYLPEFEFRPSEAFRVKVGQNMRFDVVNQLDLLLQERGLMADALVVEAVSDSCRTSVIWLRYDPQKLSDHGISNCTLYADDSDTVFNGICGVLCNRKRV